MEKAKELFKACVNNEIAYVYQEQKRINDNGVYKYISNPNQAARKVFIRYRKKFGIAKVTDLQRKNNNGIFERVEFSIN